MPNHHVVSQQEWIAARKQLLAKEKERRSLGSCRALRAPPLASPPRAFEHVSPVPNPSLQSTRYGLRPSRPAELKR
jgi:hypothetical protein